MKRMVLFGLVMVLAACLLTSCGKPVDHYMEGYLAVKDGRYEDALLSFSKAAEEGDTQAATAAEIITGYFSAREAFLLGDLDSAKEFLEDIPANYKYYDISTDIDDLRRQVYGGDLPQDDLSETDTTTNGEEIDRLLSRAEDYVQAEDYVKAKELLGNLPKGKLSSVQMQWVARLWLNIPQEEEAETTNAPTPTEEPAPVQTQAPSLSSEKAAAYLKVAYPEIEGDVGGALVPQYDEDGNLYYAITIQTEEDVIKTVHIFPDGSVKTVN